MESSESGKGGPPDQVPGVTPSERYLGSLARRSFLSIWSYSNLFIDRGRRGGKGSGKELCDLVVVFDNNILLFSDKHCAFPENEDIEVAWRRWYRRAIEGSVRQLFGAEAWIRRFPDRIFLDKCCTRRFPFPIPDASSARFYRLAVTRGAYPKCKEFFGRASSGSLMINTGVRGAEHLDRPFQIGDVSPGRGFIHVLDELTLNVLMKELDTISDFVGYLERKEAFLLQSDHLVVAPGEEELVAIYLKGINKKSEHVFPAIPEDRRNVLIEEGGWEGLVRCREYQNKKKADQISYFWDSLIEGFVTHGRNHAGASLADSPDAVADFEPALRVMAAESRLRRRHFATQLLEVLNTDVKPGQRLTRLGSVEEFPDTAYLFLVMPQPTFMSDYDAYFRVRTQFLLACCKVAMLYRPNARRIVGIATEPRAPDGRSSVLILLVAGDRGWTQEQLAEARQLQTTHHILANETTTSVSIKEREYPDVGIVRTAKPPRGQHRPIRNLNRAQRRAQERKKKGRKKTR